MRRKQCSAYETAGKLKANREGKKNGFISPDGLASSREKRGMLRLCPHLKTSSTLSHSHLNEGTLKSVIGLGREKGELSDRI